MKKIQKVLSLVLAVVMVMSMGAVSAFATGDFIPTQDGTYTADLVVAWNYYTPTNTSMCNGVFAAEADVTIDGEWATLHLYVCNPTPSWGGLDTGILSNASITVDGVDYTGELTSIGNTDADAAVKLFTQDASFFGITTDTYYACDTMEFVIPTAALASNIEISAFVNLVMNSQQSFWLDINWLENTDEDADTDADANVETYSQEVQICAEVEYVPNPSTYTVTIPENIIADEYLSTTEDTAIGYDIFVDITEGDDDVTVVVSTPEEGVLTNEAGDELAFVNLMQDLQDEFNKYYGVIGFYADDVAVAAAGVYTGSVVFEITATRA
ncbi:MAG: hypothetical protein R3Y27_01770 [Clostridia bacterium]